MTVAQDLNYANFATNQGEQTPTPVTLASTTTIAPTTLVTFLTGTVQIATITPPLQGQHVLILIFTNGSPGTLLTTGNIKTATAPAQNVPVIAVYDPNTALYWTGKLA